jgi:hypothetical protein
MYRQREREEATMRLGKSTDGNTIKKKKNIGIVGKE